MNSSKTYQNINNRLIIILQCMIIRNTELAAAQEKLNELEQKKDETLKLYSTTSLLQKLQGEWVDDVFCLFGLLQS